MRLFCTTLGAFLAWAVPVVLAAQGTKDTPTDYTVAPDIHPDETTLGPQRIVSIAPSATELCAALGLADRVVGRTQFCKWPPAVERARIVGGQTDTNLEAILALKPDLVLITEGSRQTLSDTLKSLKLQVVTLPDETLDELYRAIDELGQACARPKTARRLVTHLSDDIRRLTERAGNHRHVRVLFSITDLPLEPGSIFVAGPKGHMDELLRRAGYGNAASDVVDRPWTPLSLEQLVAARPDVILEFRPQSKAINADTFYRSWSNMRMVPAIERRRVCSLTESTAMIPGARVNIALHDIITTLDDCTD